MKSLVGRERERESVCVCVCVWVSLQGEWRWDFVVRVQKSDVFFSAAGAGAVKPLE